MNALFEECRAALGRHFRIPEKHQCDWIMNLLYSFPMQCGCVQWHKLNSTEYVSAAALLRAQASDFPVWVVADSQDIPIFQTRLFTALTNMDDVSALCPKIFLFDETRIVQPLFPDEAMILGTK